MAEREEVLAIDWLNRKYNASGGDRSLLRVARSRWLHHMRRGVAYRAVRVGQPIGMEMGFRHKLNMVANLLECTERLIHIGRNLAICLECLSGSRNFDSFQVRREFSTSFCSANLLSFNRGR